MNANGTVKSSVKLASGTNGGPTLADSDRFGFSMTSLGDLDGDGVTDLAVGATGDNTGGLDRGAVYVLLLNANGTVKSSVKLASAMNGGPTLATYDNFGSSVASLGDLDGDGVTDLAVGAYADDTGGTGFVADRGAVHVLLLNSNGTVKSSVKLASAMNGGPTLADGDHFGRSVASLGDMNGDGVIDLAVGARLDDTGGTNRGAVHVLFLNPLPIDFGDAPDTSAGTGTGNYQTLVANGGPSHVINATQTTLFLGTRVDGETNSTPNTKALGDDVVTVFSRSASDVPLSIIDLATVTSHLIVSGNTGTLIDVNVALDLTHTFDGDLLIKLVSPSGTQVVLTNSRGGGGDNFLLTTFDDEAANSIASGSAPFTGVFRPDASLSAFDNQSINGDWQLVITDQAGADVGVLNSWSLTFTTMPDDENGLIEPAQDLLLTVGSAPVVRVRATNTTGSAATLFGWIDFNRDGVFDNGTERTSVTVPTATSNGTFTLTFPTIPASTTAGTTYARFRLSTDVAAANSTGEASGGEVEDYVATITRLSNGIADSTKTVKIASGTNGGPALGSVDFFGDAVTSLGDFDGDGVTDLAVGAFLDDTNGTNFGNSNRGAVHVLLLNADGTVKGSVKLASGTNGGPTLADGDNFGSSVTSLGDLDGDGVTDLAVGATSDDTGGTDRGAIYVLLLNANGTVKSSVKVASGTNGGPTLANGDFFSMSVASLGDLDGDGVTDLAVGANYDDTNGSDRGAVHVLFLNANGTVKSSLKIGSGTNGGPALADNDVFGRSVVTVGDLDGDNVTDLVVGAEGDDTGAADAGAVYVLRLNSNGTVKNSTKLASGTNGVSTLAIGDVFGGAVASLGDLDGDGAIDLAIGARADDTGGTDRGAVYLLFLKPENRTIRTSVNFGNLRVVNAGPDQVVAEGTPVSLSGTFAFGGAAIWHVSQSNGQTIPDATAANFSFMPTDNGVYVIEVTATFSGATYRDSVTVNVSNVAPKNVSAGGPYVINEGASLVLSGSATDDAGARDPLTDRKSVV